MTRRAAMAATVCLLAVLGATPAQADFATGARAYDGGDYATAYAEWRTLAGSGDAMAQTAIAGMHRFGEGRRVDLATALRWYRRAAQQNHVVAQMNLAEMYRIGLGVARDRSRAWLWFTIAAELGGKWAKNQLTGLERAMTPGEIERARFMFKHRKM